MDEMARKEALWLEDIWDDIMEVEGHRKRVEQTIVDELNQDLLARW